ncbi:J domain-containing protein [Natrinema versiforme]|uniref:Heat shock protein DnaJ domain-containing protein n=1 Tax=Natrinema versiforme JCM 10478 TaxID=1227496 RepID=L9Y967_9EURY|nr:J domain-containing protein [Natrinema versiforme]ELY70247.1 heat shock protein DnaJ domain-containing protein [Natrinema versiforme JCM 10478]
MERHYDVLGLSPDADERAVRRAYRTLLKTHHPDQGGSREQFLQIKDAYEAILGERVPNERETDGGAITRGGDGSQPRQQPTYDPDGREGRDRDRTHELTVSSEYLTLALAGLVHDVDLASLVDGPVTAATTRTVAFFRVHNTSSQSLPWRGKTNTSFIGDDGFLYEGSSIVAPHATDLPERWVGTDITLEPGRALDAVVIAQEMPDDVAVEQVMYAQHVPDEEGDDIADTERYLFELKPLVRERLNRLPFERD